MTRSTPEWVATHDDQAIPPRVRLRVFERAGGRCHRCKRKIGPSDRWSIEHLLALALGGQHREGNMDISCEWCKPIKDREDAALKSKGAAIRARHIGIRQRSKWQHRPLGYGNHQHTATRPIVRVRDINED